MTKLTKEQKLKFMKKIIDILRDVIYNKNIRKTGRVKKKEE